MAHVLVAAAVAAPSLVAADRLVEFAPTIEETEPIAAAFGLAYHHGEASALRDLMTAKVVVRGVVFTDKACNKKFGKDKRRTIAKKQQAKLAACIAAAGWEVPERPGPGMGTWSFSDGADRWILVSVDKDGDGKLRIAEISGNLVQETVEGIEGGVADGWVGGEVGGVVGGAPPPPPPPPAAPQNVAPTAVEGLRIAGSKLITPDDVTITDITRSGKDKIVGSFKMCLNASGDVTSVTQLKSTGFSAYDTKLKNQMSTTWRYKPYLVNGKAVPVCTAVTFIYSQK